MKLKSIITFSILLALSFSITHEFAYTFLDEEQCTVNEYVAELDAPTGVDELCDTHYEYHNIYTFSQDNIFIQDVDKTSELIIQNESYNFSINSDLVIPPIT